MHRHFKRIHRIHGGYEKRFLPGSCEGNIGGPFFGDRDVLYLFSGFVENGNAVSGKVHIAEIVDRHAIGAHIGEQPSAI